MSGYDNELYNTELAGWNTDTIQAVAQMGKHRIEKIWMNFDSGILGWIGETENEQIHKKA